MLAYLERANLFLIPLDESRTWYRYHHLFADLLRTRLASTQTALLPALHRRASHWLEANDDPKGAFDHALAAQDSDRAAAIVDRAIAARWRETDLDFFQALNRLPAEALLTRPSLALYAAWANVMISRVERVPPLLEAAERQLLIAEQPHARAHMALDGGLRAFARVLRAFSLLYRTDLAGDLRAVIAFHVDGPGGGRWFVNLSPSAASSAEGTANQPRLTLHMRNTDVFYRMLTGRLNLQLALLSGRLRLRSDLRLFSQMGSLFSVDATH